MEVAMEKIAAVHSRPLRCLGPREQDPAKLAERLRRGRRPANRVRASRKSREDVVGSLDSELTTNEQIAAAFKAGDVRRAVVLKSYANLGCGYDLRQLIAAFPFDGQRHEEPCPKCGRTVRFRSQGSADTSGE